MSQQLEKLASTNEALKGELSSASEEARVLSAKVA